MDLKTGLIYMATNKVNGKIYIGQTTKSLDERKRGHINSSKSETKRILFWRALRKHGILNFEWSVLEDNIKKEDLDYREKFHIAIYDSTNNTKGYNICNGGFACNATPEFCKTIRESKLKSGLRKTNKSGFKGVYKSRGRWRAEIDKKHIGYFENPIDAAKAYDKTALELFGENNVSTNKSLGLLDNIDEDKIEKTGYKINKNNKSGYIGVGWNKKIKAWQSQSRGNHFGFHETEKDAAIAYDLGVFKLFGENKKTNLSLGLLTENDIKTGPKERLRPTNKSGYKGLYYNTCLKKWRYLKRQKDGKKFSKCFETKEDAIEFIKNLNNK